MVIMDGNPNSRPTWAAAMEVPVRNKSCFRANRHNPQSCRTSSSNPAGAGLDSGNHRAVQAVIPGQINRLVLVAQSDHHPAPLRPARPPPDNETNERAPDDPNEPRRFSCNGFLGKTPLKRGSPQTPLPWKPFKIAFCPNLFVRAGCWGLEIRPVFLRPQTRPFLDLGTKF